MLLQKHRLFRKLLVIVSMRFRHWKIFAVKLNSLCEIQERRVYTSCEVFMGAIFYIQWFTIIKIEEVLSTKSVRYCNIIEPKTRNANFFTNHTSCYYHEDNNLKLKPKTVADSFLIIWPGTGWPGTCLGI